MCNMFRRNKYRFDGDQASFQNYPLFLHDPKGAFLMCEREGQKGHCRLDLVEFPNKNRDIAYSIPEVVFDLSFQTS